MSNELRIFPKKRQIPEKKPKSFVLFPFEMWEKRREPFEAKEAEIKRFLLLMITGKILKVAVTVIGLSALL